MLLIYSLASPGQVIAWQFGSPASTGDELSYNATTNHSQLNISVLSRGSGINTSALARSFSATNFTANGSKANAISTNQYFSFNIQAIPGYSVSLSTLDVRLRRSATGPTAYVWRYSVDGVNFFDIGTDISFTSTADGVDQAQLNLSAIPALQNVPNASIINFRLYAWGAPGSGGTFAIGRYAAGITTNSLAIGGTVGVMIPTPISLLNFSGYKQGSVNQLHWTTVAESNNRGFDVQRSNDGLSYYSIGFVNSQALNGSSHSELRYNFTDNSPAAKQYYRLMQVDFDGRNRQSPIIAIKGEKPDELIISSLFPNPAGSQLNMMLDVPARMDISIIVMDQRGREVLKQEAGLETGTNTVPVDVSKLNSGVFFVRLICNEGGKPKSGCFIKQ